MVFNEGKYYLRSGGMLDNAFEDGLDLEFSSRDEANSYKAQHEVKCTVFVCKIDDQGKYLTTSD